MADKIHKPNPKPIKGGNPTGWDKDKFGDNRDLKEANDNGGSSKS